MAELYLKNSTGSTVEISDLGWVVADGQSITIDENDFDGYLTPDLINALDDNPANGLILSTGDFGDAGAVDLPKTVATERLLMKTHWKPSRTDFIDLPTIGNEEGDVRLVESQGVLYRWSQSSMQWEKITSTFSLTVEDDMGDSATEVEKMIFVTSNGCECNDVYVGPNNTVYIGPPEAPKSLDGQSLVLSGTTLYSGRLSADNINYKTGDPAGDSVSYIVRDGTFTLETPSSAEYCNFGDLGTISFNLNGTPLSTIDLGINFSELNREGNQVISNYDIQGAGDAITNGRADFTGGYMEVISVGMYNNFKFWQKWRARVVITDDTLLRQGWNSMNISHDGITPSQVSASLDLFYDIDQRDGGPDPSISNPSLSTDIPVYNWLSGIKYYGAGSTWQVDVSATGVFNNVYHSTGAPITISGWPGVSSANIQYNDASVGGVSDPPVIGETMSISNWTLTQPANSISANARLTATPRDPYGSYAAATSASQNILVNSWGTRSTPLAEYFVDEYHRMPSNDYNVIPSDIDGQWDSTESLKDYDDGKGLQFYLDELYFPSTNFMTGFNPLQPSPPDVGETEDRDYSGLMSDTDRTFYRAFRHTGVSHANGTLLIQGVTKSQLLAGVIKVEIKAPTQTGWLDLSKDFNYPLFTSSDGDGCWVDRATQTDSQFKFSLGDNYTENSGWMIIVKITYPNQSSPRVSELRITDWV